MVFPDNLLPGNFVEYEWTDAAGMTRHRVNRANPNGYVPP